MFLNQLQTSTRPAPCAIWYISIEIRERATPLFIDDPSPMDIFAYDLTAGSSGGDVFEYQLSVSIYEGRCRMMLTGQPTLPDVVVAKSLSLVLSISVDYTKIKGIYANIVRRSKIKPTRTITVVSPLDEVVASDFVRVLVIGIDADGAQHDMVLFLRMSDARQLQQRWRGTASHYLPRVGRRGGETDINLTFHLGKLTLTELRHHTQRFATHDNVRAYAWQHDPDTKQILLTLAIYYADPADASHETQQFFRFTLSEPQWEEIRERFTECVDATRSIELPRR